MCKEENDKGQKSELDGPNGPGRTGCRVASGELEKTRRLSKGRRRKRITTTGSVTREPPGAGGAADPQEPRHAQRRNT